jgi:hypothetical protein
MNYKTIGSLLLGAAILTGCSGSNKEEYRETEVNTEQSITLTGKVVAVERTSYESSRHTIVFEDASCANSFSLLRNTDYLALATAAKDEGWTVTVTGDEVDKKTGCLNYDTLIIENTNPGE